MNSQRLLTHFLSTSATSTARGVLQRSGRCFGTVTCAKLRGRLIHLVAGSQQVCPAQQISLQRTGSNPVRSYCTAKDDVEQSAMNYIEFKDNLGAHYALVVDVREPQELKEEGKIPGTVNIPLGQVDAALSDGLVKLCKKYHLSTYDAPGGANVIFLCKAGVRAAKAVAIARKHGLENARFYKGSFLDWKERGGKIIKD